MELAPNLNGIKHQIELELELRPKYHQNPSPDSDQALELKHHYFPIPGQDRRNDDTDFDRVAAPFIHPE